jgi:hypothetical protein
MDKNSIEDLRAQLAQGLTRLTPDQLEVIAEASEAHDDEAMAELFRTSNFLIPN